MWITFLLPCSNNKIRSYSSARKSIDCCVFRLFQSEWSCEKQSSHGKYLFHSTSTGVSYFIQILGHYILIWNLGECTQSQRVWKFLQNLRYTLILFTSEITSFHFCNLNLMQNILGWNQGQFWQWTRSLHSKHNFSCVILNRFWHRPLNVEFSRHDYTLHDI